MQMNWIGSVLDPSGYGSATRGYVKALHGRKGLRLRAQGRQFFTGELPDLGDDLSLFLSLAETPLDASKPVVSVQHLTPENYRIHRWASYHIGMTTFETDSLPQAWQPPMRSQDELWTFSEWGRQTFLDTGIRRPVHVIPHGVDVDRFTPSLQYADWRRELDATRREDVGPDDDRDWFVFGSNFEWTRRKNPETLIRAYCQAFTINDPVCLVLKSYHQFPIEQSRQRIVAEVNSIRSSMGLKSRSAPKIMLLDGIMSDEDMPLFYSSLDAYVLPSCGEGWSLTTSEAMATGLPTIAVNWSGHTEYMNKDNSFLVDDFKMEEVQPGQAPDTYVGHRWAVVDVDALASTMHQVYRHHNAGDGYLSDVCDRARRTMVDRFTWRHAADAIMNRLRDIAQ